MSPTSAGRTDPQFARALLERPDAFRREDESDDSVFYGPPRLVSHLDATALGTVQSLLSGLMVEEDPAILDLMASTDSHLPSGRAFSRVTGLGMNGDELEANPALTDRVIHDLNVHPELPFSSGSFDVVLNALSVEYLIHPFRVFEEVARVLKPGGLLVVIFSNRWFPPKVVRVWEDAKEEERIGIVEEFLGKSGLFGDSDYFISMGLPRPQDDRYSSLGVPSDPVFAVFAERRGGSPGRRRRVAPEDPARMESDPAAIRARKEKVAESLECPYCQERLAKWKVPDDPCIDWPNDHLYLCFNDSCPFLVRGWRHMWNQGVVGTSYRYLFNPITGKSTTVPVRGLNDLRPGIVSGTTTSSAPEGDKKRPDFSGLPKVTRYGPDLGIPRG